jgi:hypothetical protein
LPIGEEEKWAEFSHFQAGDCQEARISIGEFGRQLRVSHEGEEEKEKEKRRKRNKMERKLMEKI